MTTCAHCSAALPDAAAYCPQCGRPATGDAAPVEVHHAEPKWFGLGPPLFVLGVAVALVLLGIVLLLAGSVAFGVLALVVGLCLFPTFLAGARRWPDHTVSRVGLSTAERVKDETGVAVESISAWSRAGRDVLRLRREQFALRRERDAKIGALGRAYYEDDARAGELKAEAKELDARIAANERELERAVREARGRVRRGRAAVVTTEVIRPGESDADEEGAAQPVPGNGGAADAADAEADAVEVEQRA
jgi:hypothetical protein